VGNYRYLVIALKSRIVSFALLDGMFKAVVNMVMHQHFLGVADGAFNGLELLGYLQALPVFFQHRDDTFQVTFDSFEPFDDVGVGSMG
jgi:hypothetical protein